MDGLLAGSCAPGTKRVRETVVETSGMRLSSRPCHSGTQTDRMATTSKIADHWVMEE